MPELAELLREVAGTHEAPDLRRALVRRRRRRNRRRVVVGAVVVLLAVVGAGLAVRTPEPVRTLSRPPVDRIPIQGRIQGIADDGRYLYVGVQQQRRWRLDWFDEVTGELVGTAQIWDPIQDLVLGGDYVWVAGRNPFDEMRGGVSRVDVRTGQYERVLEWGPRTTGLYGGIDLTWDGQAVWAADGHAEVDRIPLQGEPTRVPVDGQPHSIAVASSGTWVSFGDGTIGRVDLGGADPVIERHDWGGPIFASSGDGVWSTDDGLRVVELFPENLGSGISVSLGDRLGIGSTPVTGVVPDADGIWVVREEGSEHWQRDAARADEVVDRPGPLIVGPTAVWVADPTTYGVRGVVHRVG